MGKKINDKTAGINLDGFQPRAKVVDGQPVVAQNTSSVLTPNRDGVKSFTGAGIFMAAITGKDEVSKELEDVQAKLDAAERNAEWYADADLVKALDPSVVRRSQWANRDPSEFKTPEFQALKDEIRSAGGNTQPIKVRRVAGVVDGQPEHFEIVYGHRRYQACLEEGLKVNAVIVDRMTDVQLFEAMERENRGRKNLSAWEQGMMYQDALKKGLYASARKMEDALNLNHSDCARALQLAKLPMTVVQAFESPLDLQVRWAKHLTDALQKDPEGLLANAREITKNRNGKSPSEVFDGLIGKPSSTMSDVQEISVAGKKLALFKVGPKGRVVLEFEPGALKPQKHAELVALVSKLLAR